MIDKLAAAGITELRAGETVGNALDYVDKKIPFRKGHIVGKNKHETIFLNNKEAFSKTFTRPFYHESSLIEQDINTIPIEVLESMEDYRENTDEIGVLQPCQYCGLAMRCDEEGQYDIFNCNSRDCHSTAIWDNCM